MKRLLGVLILAAAAASLSAQAALDSFRQGQAAFARDDWWGAVDAYRNALVSNPRYFDAFQGLAESFFALGEYDEASKQVLAALKLGPLSSTVNVLYGRILLGQMKYEEALAQFQGVLVREPKNQAAQFGLAEYQVMKGRLEQASNQFEVLRKEDPTNLRALLSLLYLASARGDRNSFDRVFSDALRFHSADPRIHLAAAEEMYRRQDRILRRDCFEFLERTGPQPLAVPDRGASQPGLDRERIEPQSPAELIERQRLEVLSRQVLGPVEVDLRLALPKLVLGLGLAEQPGFVGKRIGFVVGIEA